MKIIAQMTHKRAASQDSARGLSERFRPKIKFEQRRNTLCTRKGYAASVSQLTLATAVLYFKLLKLQDWGERSAEARRRILGCCPKIYTIHKLGVAKSFDNW